MEGYGGLRKALRIVLYVVILFNAVTLIVYFRTQEVRLQYRLSKLQAQLAAQEREGRELAQRWLDASRGETRADVERRER
jgi:cell division protein FtsL